MPSKWLRDLQQKHHGEHMARINNMRPVVDNKQPRELPLSGKKEIERRRFREKVEKGNRLLLDRLGKALERKNIDNERKPIKFNSLEQGKKKLELKRVTMENQLLLGRIQFAQPMYNHHQWERDAEHREFYLKNMTEFPELYVNMYYVKAFRGLFLCYAMWSGALESPDLLLSHPTINNTSILQFGVVHWKGKP